MHADAAPPARPSAWRTPLRRALIPAGTRSHSGLRTSILSDPSIINNGSSQCLTQFSSGSRSRCSSVIMSSSSSSSPLPYFCPRCGDRSRFPSVAELRAHLVSRHTYETLLVLSQARRSGPALLPLPGPAAAQSEASPPNMEAQGFPLPLACLDLASSSASVQLLRGIFGPPDRPGQEPCTALARPGSLVPGASGVLDFRLTVDIGLEERLGLGLDRKISRTFAEVEEKVNRRVGRLRAELQRREAELERKRRERERLRREKEEVEERAAYLSRQVSVAMEMTERLKTNLAERETELSERHQSVSFRAFLVVELRFISCCQTFSTSSKSLTDLRQVFIESLLERADRAERQLLLLLGNNHFAHNRFRYGEPNSPSEVYSPGPGRSLDGSTDDVIASEMQQSLGNRVDSDICTRNMCDTSMSHQRSYSVSSSYRLGEPTHRHSGLSDQMRTLSLGSGGWDSEGGRVHFHPSHCAAHWTPPDGEEFRRRERVWVSEEGWGRTWSKRNLRHHSTEEEEEEEEEEEGLWSSAEMRRLILARKYTPGSDTPSSVGSTPSRCHANRTPGADTLRMRAGLFCVFPYLDVRSLLLAAEVCCDWRFVARHPAVWTRLRLENARVSAEFLQTLSQWCTQTQSVILNNLKPRSRRPDETREDYGVCLRGSVEPGLEALLRSAGGSLLLLSVSRCPHILTDRTLWMASCYCRNLQTLTYRSSSDPVGQEVLWVLGAGCRNISSLQVAPSHPSQQPTRFGNRCLQTIGRCWPRLRCLSVGGAGCSTQGLVAVVRSCTHLQTLELERVTDLSLQVAAELCRAGLKGLQTLILTHTPVSGQAVLHFHSVCSNIRSIVVDVSVSDYFEEPDTQEAKHLFGEILSTLKVLQTRPGLCDALQVKAGGFS
ncbi:F-box only protein 41-like [Poecilia reticulata]|uniref:F-box only protein 41-like n=1 Tax=Poecilia reticulata TaxID=8081 RepID=UPI0007EB4F9E|nr:PREDICTED: F-box only protein 41-like [Poecilia reticulata]